MISKNINISRFNCGHWQVVPIFDCPWKKRILIIAGSCTRLNEMVKVVVPGRSFELVKSKVGWIVLIVGRGFNRW